jgi:hypothetical protein
LSLTMVGMALLRWRHIITRKKRRIQSLVLRREVVRKRTSDKVLSEIVRKRTRGKGMRWWLGKGAMMSWKRRKRAEGKGQLPVSELR